MLPLFSKNSPCKKCSTQASRTVFVAKCCDTPEYLKRTCECCGYDWRERPLDQRTPEEEEAVRPKPFPTYRYTTGD